MTTICADGCGGSISALSFCDIYHNFYPKESIGAHFICSDKVFQVIKQFAPHFIVLHHHKDGSDDLALCEKLKKHDVNTFCLTPDYFGNTRNYSISRTGIDWEMIKENRFLFKQFPLQQNNNVFLGLLSAQDNNTYLESEILIEKLCFRYPNYKFYFADVKKWSGKNTELGFDLQKLAANYPNFIPYHPEDIISDFIFLAKNIRYFISVDNGVGNFAYVLGRKRILIDSRYNSLAFKLRWRQSESDLIPFNTSSDDIVKIFGLMINNPELNGILKRYMLAYPPAVLKRACVYKENQVFII